MGNETVYWDGRQEAITSNGLLDGVNKFRFIYRRKILKLLKIPPPAWYFLAG